MAKKPRAHELIDWTISYAPEAGEPLPAPAPLVRLPPRPTTLIPGKLAVQLDRRAILLILSPLVIALVTVNLASAWNSYRLRRDLSAAVAAEDQAILTGDLDSLRYNGAVAGWREAQLKRAEAMQPAPLPLHGLWPATAPAEVRAVKATGPNTARAEVARTYYAPDGRAADFVLPQYYQYAGDIWQRTASPTAQTDSVTQWRGYYIDASYYAADEALVLVVSAALDANMAEACALWACPSGLRFDVRFLLDDAAPLRRFDYFASDPATPWLYTILLGRRDAFEGSLTVLLPAPHLAGIPADATSRHVYVSGISLELLARLAAHLSPVGQRHNALPYALAARLGAELGLEAPTMAQARSGQAVFSPDELWRLNFVSTEQPFGPYYTQAAQQQALSLVNNLLDGQPAEAAGRMFTGLATEMDPVAWAASALQISPEAAAARVQAAIAPAAPAPARLVTQQTFTLGCRDGLAGLTVGQSAPPYALVGRLVDARPLAWSPGGDYLLASLAGRLSLIAAENGVVMALPDSNGYLASAAWVTDDIVAYILWPYQALSRRLDPTAFSLRFYDAAHPERSPAPVPGVLAYALAPDRSTAAVVLADPSAPVFSRQGEIYRMPALGGNLTRIGEGESPAWSPNGRELAFAHIDGATVVLRVYDTATGLNRTLYRSSRLRGRNATMDLNVVWSPAGGQIALEARGGLAGPDDTLWLIPADGGPGQVVVELNDPTYPYPGQFSADGRFLAVTTWSPYWPRLTEIFDAATGATLARVPSAGGVATWAPEGHALAVGSFEGLFLLAEPETGVTTRLTGEACYAALWN